MSIINLEEVISSAILSHLERQGMSRQDMVQRLADELEVRLPDGSLSEAVAARKEGGQPGEQIVLEVASMLGVNLDDITGNTGPATIRDGDRVATPQGEAVARIITPEEHRLLERLMGAARSAA